MHNLHNMIVEDEGHAISIWDHEEINTFMANQDSTPEFGEYLRRNTELRDSQVHYQLCHDLVQHIWETCRHDQWTINELLNIWLFEFTNCQNIWITMLYQLFVK